MSRDPDPRRSWGVATGVMLLFLSVFLMLASVVWAVSLCTNATYSCPANGCGDIAQENCRGSAAVLPWVIVLALPLAVIGELTILKSQRTPAPP